MTQGVACSILGSERAEEAREEQERRSRAGAAPLLHGDATKERKAQAAVEYAFGNGSHAVANAGLAQCVRDRRHGLEIEGICRGAARYDGGGGGAENANLVGIESMGPRPVHYRRGGRIPDRSPGLLRGQTGVHPDEQRRLHVS